MSSSTSALDPGTTISAPRNLIQENAALKNLLVAWQNAFAEIEALYKNAEKEKNQMVLDTQENIAKIQADLKSSSATIREENSKLTEDVSVMRKNLTEAIETVSSEYQRNKNLISVLHTIRQQMKLILIERQIEAIDREEELNRFEEEAQKKIGGGNYSTTCASRIINDDQLMDIAKSQSGGGRRASTTILLTNDENKPVNKNNPLALEKACEKLAMQRQKLKVQRDHLNKEIATLTMHSSKMANELSYVQGEFEAYLQKKEGRDSPLQGLVDFIQSKGPSAIKDILEGQEFEQNSPGLGIFFFNEGDVVREESPMQQNTSPIQKNTRRSSPMNNGRGKEQHETEEEFLELLNRRRITNIITNPVRKMENETVVKLEKLLWYEACKKANMTSFNDMLQRVHGKWHFNKHKLDTSLSLLDGENYELVVKIPQNLMKDPTSIPEWIPPDRFLKVYGTKLSFTPAV